MKPEPWMTRDAAATHEAGPLFATSSLTTENIMSRYIHAEPSGRFQALLIRADGSVAHLHAREQLQEAIDDADVDGADVDAQAVALRPIRVVASREAGTAWRRT